MPIPRTLLIGRKSLEQHEAAIKEAINSYGVQMAIAFSPEDAAQAQKLTSAVAQLQHTTVIVADFPIDMVIDEEGHVEPLGITVPQVNESPLITEV